MLCNRMFCICCFIYGIILAQTRYIATVKLSVQLYRAALEFLSFNFVLKLLGITSRNILHVRIHQAEDIVLSVFP